MASPLGSRLTDLNEYLISPCRDRVEYRLDFKNNHAAQIFVNALRSLVNLGKLARVTILNNQKLNFSIPIDQAGTTKKVVRLMKDYLPSFEQPSVDLAMKRVDEANWVRTETLTSSCRENRTYELNQIVCVNIRGQKQHYVDDGCNCIIPDVMYAPTIRKFPPNLPMSHLEKREEGYYEMVPSKNVPESDVEYESDNCCCVAAVYEKLL